MRRRRPRRWRRWPRIHSSAGVRRAGRPGREGSERDRSSRFLAKRDAPQRGAGDNGVDGVGHGRLLVLRRQPGRDAIHATNHATNHAIDRAADHATHHAAARVAGPGLVPGQGQRESPVPRRSRRPAVHAERRFSTVSVRQPLGGRHGVLLRQPAGHGFNAAWVNLLCGPYTFGRSDASTFDKIQPFTTDERPVHTQPAVLGANGRDGRPGQEVWNHARARPGRDGELHRVAEGQRCRQEPCLWTVPRRALPRRCEHHLDAR